MARLPSYIRRVDTDSGVRYEVRVHGARPDGSRFQHKRRFVTPSDASAWFTQISAELAAGTHAAPTGVTVGEACRRWLDAKAARGKPSTAAAYRFALAPVITSYGDLGAQKITKQHVEALVIELRDGTGVYGVWRGPASTQ